MQANKNICWVLLKEEKDMKHTNTHVHTYLHTIFKIKFHKCIHWEESIGYLQNKHSLFGGVSEE